MDVTGEALKTLSEGRILMRIAQYRVLR